MICSIPYDNKNFDDVLSSVGVAIITFNGECYIHDQLESIRCQSLPPNRVIIFDDCSSDKTVELVTKFITRNHLYNWQLFERDTNVGWRKNIFDALMRCSTDIIFWSDQDDVWDKNKIKTLTALMNDRNCMAAYSSWGYINSSGTDLKFFSGNNTERIVQLNNYSKKLDIPPLLGCSACFNRKLISPLSRVIPCEFDSSDWILYLLAIILGNVTYLDKPLFKRRVHDKNLTTSLSGMKRNWNFNYGSYKKSLEILKLQLETIEKITKVTLGTSDISNSFIENERNYLNCRINFVEERKKFVEYLYFSYKQNLFADFVCTLIKDILFVYHSTKNSTLI